MKMNTTFNTKITSRPLYLSAFIFALLFSAAGVALLKFGLAEYDRSPLGYIDYCQLEGTSTTLYGWASDPDVSPGIAPSVSVRVSNGININADTGISNYRDAAINEFLAARGIPSSSVYGFKINLGRLSKGTVYGLSGTINNSGQGANSTLIVNNGIASINGQPDFPGNNIPDACLAVPPPPPPPPPPPQAPDQTPAETSEPEPQEPDMPGLSANSDAKVTTGSIVTTLLIPNGNADKIVIEYGTTEQALDLTTEPAVVTPDATTIFLKELAPATSYFYQINRLKNDDTFETSPVATFKTLGLDVVLTFKRGDQTIPGILVSIANLGITATTDEKGSVLLKQVPLGKQSLSFKHDGKDYTREFDVILEAVQEEALKAPVQAVLASDISLDDSEEGAGNTTKKGSNKLWIILPVLLLLGLAGGGIFWFIKRRNSLDPSDDTSFLPSDLTPVPPVAGIPPAPQPINLTLPTNMPPSGQPPIPHSGESLKDLVIQSMREEAARKQAEQNNLKTPPPPENP